MSNKICLVDFLSYKNSHTKFNSAMISEIKEIDTFYCEQSHGKEINRLVKKSINIESKDKTSAWYFLREIHLLRVLLKNKNKKILILGSTGLGYLLISILATLGVVKKGHIRCIIHSELEGLRSNNLGWQKKFFSIAVKKLNFFSNFKCAILSEHILDSDFIGQEYKELLHLVQHPPMPFLSKTNKDKGARVKNEAIIGLIRNDTKDIDLINEFAYKAYSKGIRVFAYGRKASEVELNQYIVDKTVKHIYTEEYIVSSLENIDAILCAHKLDHYELTASGGAFDWLTYQKIGLFFRHPCFRFLTDIPGAFVSKNTEEMVNSITNESINNISSFDDSYEKIYDKFHKSLKIYVSD